MPDPTVFPFAYQMTPSDGNLLPPVEPIWVRLKPSNLQVLKKSFRDPSKKQESILEKDVVDEIIFRTEYPRNRLMLELMARGGMGEGKFLNLKAGEVDERKLSINNPKSSGQSKVAFVPKKVAERLRDSISSKEIRTADRIFSMGYTGARAIVKKAGRAVGIDLCPP